MAEIETLRNHIIESGYILDKEDEHHIFASGMHGRKIDFDLVSTESDLYKEWVSVNAGVIQERYPKLPDMVLGVANGTNRLAPDVADELSGVIGLETRKDSDNPKLTRLNKTARQVINVLRPKLVVILEDVGTTGGTSVTSALAALEAGAENVEVLISWQRREQLEKLELAGINYSSIIYEPLPTFSRQDCEIDGYCAEGARLIDRDGQVIRMKQM